ncbi:TlpA family protein disulfide reductase [Flavobacterium microcysteis]|uniref:Redoxin domain-containing protein n=1 Tax=Flavobacterium microcysteis TaxID=2596891 RepID=A0A501PZT0_9FLAO|nr:TlpA family protein disulfide reductase [Flavobacterium microcysteis]TPD65574.1 redoxin domain-containing protein [Flavobacterium microcysteis]
MKKTLLITFITILGLFLFLILLFKDSDILKNLRITTKAQEYKEAEKYALKNSPFYDKYYKDENVIVLNIWATWCEPCIEEMPLLNRLKKQYSDKKNIVFLSLSTDKDSVKIKSFLATSKFDFEDISLENFPYRKYILNQLNSKESVSDNYFIKIESEEIPITYILNKQKTIYSYKGKIDSVDIYNRIDSILK